MRKQCGLKQADFLQVELNIDALTQWSKGEVIDHI